MFPLGHFDFNSSNLDSSRAKDPCTSSWFQDENNVLGSSSGHCSCHVICSRIRIYAQSGRLIYGIRLLKLCKILVLLSEETTVFIVQSLNYPFLTAEISGNGLNNGWFVSFGQKNHEERRNNFFSKSSLKHLKTESPHPIKKSLNNPDVRLTSANIIHR